MNKTILISTIIALTAVGITSAYAINLDLKADTTVTGDFGVTGTISGVGTVPIGTVLDWWCSVDCTIPDGFVIADGQLISDAASPFDGENVPDLTDTFIRGVTNVGNVGNTGGASSHVHFMQNHAHITFNDGAHSHSVNPSLASTGLTDSVHNHEWAQIDALERWRTWESNGFTVQTIVEWNNGMDTVGAGHFPLSRSCKDNNCVFDSFWTKDTSINHKHNYDVPNTPTTTAGDHNHGFTGAPDGDPNTGSAGNEPPFFGLVKIIRIK